MPPEGLTEGQTEEVNERNAIAASIVSQNCIDFFSDLPQYAITLLTILCLRVILLCR